MGVPCRKLEDNLRHGEYDVNHGRAIWRKIAQKEKETQMNIEDQEIRNNEKPARAKSVLAGLLIGGIVGAGTMLLFAPQAGVKTRTELQQGAIRLRDKTSETVKDKVTQAKTKASQIKADMQIKVGDLQHKGQDLLARQLERVSHAAEAGKKAIENSKEGHTVV
jgi:gas vesicle protein